MAHLLGGERIHLEYPARVLFEDVTLGVSEGDRIGVVGRNGDGKSTLLSILSLRLPPDTGKVSVRNGITIGFLDQSDTLDGSMTVSEAIVGDTPEYEWARNSRIRDVISGLLEEIVLDTKIAQLSGGERRRVSLAKLLIDDWDLLFLDEPTNHLDVEAVAWLTSHINSRWPRNAGGLLVVTHDRWFLDEVCNNTWEVHDGIVEQFEGGYAAYVLKRVERDRMANASEMKRQNLMRKELAWLRRGAPARTSKPKFRIEAANELIAKEPVVRNSTELSALSLARLGKEVVELFDVSVSYDSKILLNRVDWKIGPGDRIGILGANGVGKSTLLAIVSGTRVPDSGKVSRGSTVKLASLTQDARMLAELGDLRLHEVVSKYKVTYMAAGREVSSAQLLERLGFRPIDMAAKIREFSGGQLRRLQFLLTLLEEPNVLILDEPTNDMDVEMLAAIEDLLDSWPGTLLVVSHDRYLLERTTDIIYAIIDGSFIQLPRGVDQFLELRSRRKNQTPDILRSESKSDPANIPASDEGLGTSVNRTRRKSSKELVVLERKLKRFDEELQRAKTALESHDYHDYLGIAEKSKVIRDLEQEVAAIEEQWLELSLLHDD